VITSSVTLLISDYKLPHTGSTSRFWSLRWKMSASAIIQPLPQHATFAQCQEYRRVVLNLPGPVDRWLTTNSRSPRIDFLQDYLMLEDVRVEYVDCVVESVCVKVCILMFCFRTTLNLVQQSRYSCQYTLYITASVSFRSRRLFLRTSPQAILEQFFGSSEAIDAPEWTRWGKPTLEFQQPKATFAALFLRMADWTENQNQV
jgi:hypothetical protein